MTRHNNSDMENFFATASKEELIDYLVKKINNEVEKGDDADCDLIRECSDWLDELTKDEVVFTPEELERNLEKIKAIMVADKSFKKRKKISGKTFVRATLIAAVVFTISILCLLAVARNQGYDSALEFIFASGDKIFELYIGEQIKDDSITVIKNTESVQYNTIDDFLKAESLFILYPKSMPHNVKIRQIRFEYESDTKYTLFFVLTNSSYTFFVTNYYSVNPSSLNIYKCVSINNCNFYIIQKNESTYYAICQNEGFEYTIQSPNYDDLISILNNMKG